MTAHIFEQNRVIELRIMFRRMFRLYIYMNNTTEKSHKTRKQFYCEKCNYTCSKKNDFGKHLQSKKHNTTTTTKIQQASIQLNYCIFVTFCKFGNLRNINNLGYSILELFPIIQKVPI